MSDTVQTEIDARGTATVWLNRPDVHNAFDDELIGALTKELKRLEADKSVRVVVLEGRGKSLSAGADFNWMKRAAKYSQAENVRDAQALADLLRALNRLKKPTIAAVQGNAFGGGVGLVACCDIAFAADHVHFAFTEARLGLIPATIGPYVVRAIGQREARRYFLTAESFGAEEALRIGLVHQICRLVDLNRLIRQTVDALLACGPVAQKEIKKLVRRVQYGSIDSAMIADTAERIAAMRVSAEGQEGMAAFLEKRKPAWRKE
ncbi:MAG TPA: enoyl-CoA hydratase/isomerase family protein [Alphaproteobacteria bacterium]|nr:enoyl-CoA hydratase/isomerase family protein [Alphaproteobacteria bacterium]